jgi:hypothetical protein
MKYNNNKTVKFRGGEEPIQPAIQPEIQPPITIGEPTNIQSGEQSQPSDMDQQQPPSEMGPSEMDQQQQPPPSEMGPSEMDQQQPPSEMGPSEMGPSEMGPSEMDQQQQQPPSEMPPSEMDQQQQQQQQQPPSEMPPSEMDQQQPPSEMPPSEIDQQPEMPPSEMDQQPEMGPSEMDQQPKEDKPIIPVEPLLPPSSEEESEEIAEFRKKMEDPTNKRDYFYINTNISTELNKDKRYKREGVLHFTDSTSIKSNTTIGSLVGQTSLENVTYDKLRNTALKKVDILLGENRRCYNTHIEFERNTDTVFIHIYGTLYVKKSL